MQKILCCLMATIAIYAIQSCASRNRDDAEEQFQARVIGMQLASESADERMLWVCNNAGPKSYKNGVLKQEFWPNYVIKIYGTDASPTRSVFIEQGALEKILGEYIVDSKESAEGIDAYTFVSTTDQAKLHLNVAASTVIAQAEVFNGLNPQSHRVELSCAKAKR